MNGKPSDHPINDSLDHGIAVFSTEADALVHELARLVPRYRRVNLLDRPSPAPIEELTTRLRQIRDDPVEDARRRDWEA